MERSLNTHVLREHVWQLIVRTALQNQQPVLRELQPR
jgi:hypothetical protein